MLSVAVWRKNRDDFMDFFHKFCELTTAVKREKTSVLPVSAGEKKGTGG